MASILHHGIHHKCLDLLSHGLEKMKIINLCNLEMFVGWNPHSDLNQRASKHDSFAFVSVHESIDYHGTHYQCFNLVSYGLEKVNMCFFKLVV
jgi:hypothetical protein